MNKLVQDQRLEIGEGEAFPDRPQPTKQGTCAASSRNEGTCLSIFVCLGGQYLYSIQWNIRICQIWGRANVQ